MYEKGYPDLKQNYELAFNHYYDACNHQIPDAFIHLGQMYKNVTISSSFRAAMLRKMRPKPSSILRRRKAIPLRYENIITSWDRAAS